jgi:nucleoside-diphosphate-sugar epimerase
MKKIVVTGGNGRVGRAVIRDLLEHGYEVLNIDITAPSDRSVPFRSVDLTDYGQTFVCLHGADAVIHLAANPAPDRDMQTGAATFHQNNSSTYNIFNAATTLGLQRVVWASSITVFGFPNNVTKPVYAPLDEAHPVIPESNYALSKVMGEEMARHFTQWSGTPIIGLRFSFVVADETVYAQFPAWWQDINVYKRAALWSFADARDIAQACRLSLEADVQGAEVFNIAHGETMMPQPSRDLVAATWPDVPVAESISGNQTIFSIDKARRMLGFVPQHHWRDYVQEGQKV